MILLMDKNKDKKLMQKDRKIIKLFLLFLYLLNLCILVYLLE
jgi:hypothetical protein